MNKANYKAWEIDEKNYPKDASLASQIQFISRYGNLAPSTHNTQPWVSTVEGSSLEIEPDLTRHLPAADPTGRNLFVSLGAYSFNVQVAAAHFGFQTELSCVGTDQDDARIIIKFSKSKKVDLSSADLFPQIPRRYSEKRIVPGVPIDPNIISDLEKTGDKTNPVCLVTDQIAINSLADLCYKSAASYAEHPDFARELSGWLRGNGTSKFDGMPGFMNGLSGPKALVGKALTHLTPKSLKVLSKKYLVLVKTSPAVGIVATDGDNWQSWVQAGIIYERLSLTASSKKLSLSPITAPIERPERKELAKYFENGSRYPQMFFRVIQTPDDFRHSPRHAASRQMIELLMIERLRKEGIEISLKSAHVNGCRINYVVAGKGQPLVLIHGANIGWGQWMPNIGELSKHFRVIAMDLPGCGGSSSVDFRKLSLDICADTVAALCKKLKVSKPSVIGHSYGAAIAIKLAGKRELNVQKVLLANPLGFSRYVPHQQKPVTLFPFAKLISRTAVKPTQANMHKFLADPLVVKDKITDELGDYFWHSVSEGSYNHPLLFMNSLTNPLILKPELLLTRQAAHLAQPLLIIAGEKDPLIPLTKLQKALKHVPNADLKILPGTGHVATLEKSHEFNKLAVEFLER